MPLHLTESEHQEIKIRLNFWLIVIGGVFGLLLLRFGFFQIVEHSKWENWAENNRIRKVTIPPARGIIYDRNHKKLADWRESNYITVIPADLTDEALEMLAKILSISPEKLKERIEKNRSWSPFIPVPVAEDINDWELAQVEEGRLMLPGVDIEVRPVRKYYADSPLASHVLGHLGEITREKLQSPEFQGYRMGDRIGVSGIEQALEKTLRGRDGFKHKLVDARGREIRIEVGSENQRRGKLDYQEMLDELEGMSRPREPGLSAVLTLDLEIQRIATRHLGTNTGSVVIMDVKTGELLALLSNPGYDPSLFTGSMSSDQWEKLQSAPRNPLLDRAIQGQYPPASIIKIILAAAALEEGIISPRTKVTCKGSYTLLDTTFGCWKRSGHGKIDLEHALVESCDVYFYLVGEKMRIDTVAEWYRKFGLGQRINIGLDEEKPGQVPDPEWKKQKKNQPWYPGETLLISIGQGYMLTTPLQAIMIPAAVANNGVLMRPQIIHHLEDQKGRPKTVFRPRVFSHDLMSPKTVWFLRRAMEEVVEDRDGTAYKYVKSDVVRIAAKTGTSQVTEKYKGKPLDEIPYRFRDHAWIIAYAPAERPRIAIVVMVEHGGSGGLAAGPIAKEIIEDIMAMQSARSPFGNSPG